MQFLMVLSVALFTRLDPGEVRPCGWLKDWFDTARDGYLTHLNECDPEFERAWVTNYTPTGVRLDWHFSKDGETGKEVPGFWSAEGGAYWFGGVVPMSAQLDDAALRALARKRLDPLIGRMHPRALSFLWWLNRDNPGDIGQVTDPQRHDRAWAFHACGIFARALCDYYRVTHDPQVLAALEIGLDDPRVLKWSAAAISSACEAYALGAKRIGPALDAMIAAGDDVRQYFDCGPKARGAKIPHPISGLWYWEPKCHGVMLHECLIANVRLYAYTHDRHYLDAACEWLAFLDSFAMQPYGVPVTDEGFGLTGGSRGTETCDIFLSNYLRSELFAVTGDGAWCDDVERGFFNAAAGCVSRDFKSHCYIQSPDMPTKDLPRDRLTYSSGEGATRCRMKRVHFPLCCTASLCRNLPGFLSAAWMRTAEDGLVAALWSPCNVRTRVRGREINLAVETDYPFGETVDLTVSSPDGAIAFPLFLRVPRWCRKPCLTLNGESLASPTERRFVKIDRIWREGDRIRLVFPMRPKLETGLDRNSPTPRGWAAVTCGPLLFSLGIPETDENTGANPAFAYDYALDPKTALRDAQVIRKGMPKRWTWPFDAPVSVSVRASTGENLKLIPYGCTRLRKTMFACPDRREE